MASEIRVNKIENRSGLGTVTFADTGVDLAGIVTATTFSGSGASLTNIPDSALSAVTASKLTGALPAISGASLTGMASTDNVRTGILDVAGISTFRNTMNVGTAVTISESGIEATGVGITVANINGGQISGRKNIIINGAMNVAQRGTSDTGTGLKTIDRFNSQGNGSQGVTQSQDTDVPTGQGFSKSLKFDCTTANASPSAGNYLSITYRIEAQDLQHIANGTSNAKKLTLSFWVKSPKTGNHAVGLYKPDNTQRQQTKTYSVSAANTWEKKTITYDGDTSGGGIANDNGSGIQIDWHLMSGSNYTSVDSTSWVNYSDAAWAYGHAVNVLDDTANNFYITGVQLEVGSQATAFEHRSFGEELALCQRYYYRMQNGSSGAYWVGHVTAYGSNNNVVMIFLPVCMRDSPSLGVSSTNSDFQLWGSATVENMSNAPTLRSSNGINPQVVAVDLTHNITTGHSRILRMANQAFFEFIAEI